MVHVVFSTSARGSLRMALAGAGGAAAVGAIGGTGGPLGRLAAKREAARSKRETAEAPPLEGTPADVLCLPLALSVGDISEAEPGGRRKGVLAGLWAMGPFENEEFADKMLTEARRALEALDRRAGAGETVRVWQGPGADDACGLRFLAHRLRPLGFDKLRAERARLPEFWPRPDGTAVRCDGWGEVEPQHWAALADPEPLAAPVLNALAQEWAALRAENAPLRAVVNGRLMSAAENFYDGFVLEVLRAQPEQFREAEAIGRLLGSLRTGVSDGFAAMRLEALVRKGLLEVVSGPQPGRPVYDRVLRKKGM